MNLCGPTRVSGAERDRRSTRPSGPAAQPLAGRVLPPRGWPLRARRSADCARGRPAPDRAGTPPRRWTRRSAGAAPWLGGICRSIAAMRAGAASAASAKIVNGIRFFSVSRNTAVSLHQTTDLGRRGPARNRRAVLDQELGVEAKERRARGKEGNRESGEPDSRSGRVAAALDGRRDPLEIRAGDGGGGGGRVDGSRAAGRRRAAAAGHLRRDGGRGGARRTAGPHRCGSGARDEEQDGDGGS